MKQMFVRMCAAIGVALVASLARGQNLDEMVKWTSAEVIHYDVVAEYGGTVPVLQAPANSPVSGYETQVKDRYELGFDWNPMTMAMLGNAAIRNFPATLPAGTPGPTMFGNQCPQPKMNGSYDFAEVTEAKTGSGGNFLALGIRRTYPAGSIPYAGEGPCNNSFDVPSKTEDVTGGILVPPGLYLAMPAAAGGGNITVGKDGKTITIADPPNGWTYTFTLKVVK